jgi:hypothetical protein
MQEKKVLISTYTGEPEQPVRIYFRVYNAKTVLGVFKKLRCVYFEPARNCWRWIYDHEAKKIRFDISYNKVPKQYRPVVLGDFFFRGDQEMFLDVRSFERASKAIAFFYHRINRRAAEITKIRVVNKFFSNSEPLLEERLTPPFDYFFERDDIEIPDPQELENKLQDIEQEIEDKDTRMAAFDAYIEEQITKTLPEIEEIPAHIYEDGLIHLEMSLIIRHMEATEHWNGNKNYNRLDVFQDLFGDLEDIDEEE